MAEIEGHQYASKLVSQTSSSITLSLSAQLFLLTKEEAIFRTPFANESRAFARLESIGHNGTWAVKCFGWIKLSDGQFESISKVVDLCGSTRWAIVKEYISTPTVPSHIPTTLTNFAIPRKAWMIPDDTRPQNYRGPYIVDLGKTITFPHPLWDVNWSDWFYENTAQGPKYWTYRDGEFFEFC